MMARRKAPEPKRYFHSVEVTEFEGGRIVNECREEPGRRSLLVVGMWRSKGAIAAEPAPAIGDILAGVLARPWEG